jgi:hypothetical protein
LNPREGELERERERERGRELLRRNPSFIVVRLDLKNAYNEMQRKARVGAGILQGALFVIQVCNLHQKYSILDNGDFSGPGK